MAYDPAQRARPRRPMGRPRRQGPAPVATTASVPQHSRDGLHTLQERYGLVSEMEAVRAALRMFDAGLVPATQDVAGSNMTVMPPHLAQPQEEQTTISLYLTEKDRQVIARLQHRLGWQERKYFYGALIERAVAYALHLQTPGAGLLNVHPVATPA